MKSCEYDGDPFDEPRSHPWTDAASDASFVYHDLKANPALVRTALEDLLPFQDHAAIETTYELLERLNAPDSVFESNDCAFSGPQPNQLAQVDRALQCEGRIMILLRELERNLSRERVERLTHAIHVHLATHDEDFEWGMVGTTILPVRYLDLAVADGGSPGYQLMLSYWAWGDSEAEVMENLDRVIVNLSGALEAHVAGSRTGTD